MDLFNYIKQQLTILDVVSDHVALKQMGSYWKGSCPFHSETDASFTVSPDKQIFYCFGCQSSGDVIGFIAKLENASQIDAAKILVEQYQITIPKNLESQHLPKKMGSTAEGLSYFDVCKSAALWMHKELLKNVKALDYLQARGIAQDIIERFLVGYFPGGINNVNRLVKDCAREGILANDLIAAGVIAEGKAVLYSGFEERIIFPIKDQFARFCGFGGRIFKDGDQRAKYYNSKESEGFLKGKLLFGFDLAKKNLQLEKAAFLVEGYTDCITMVQHGWLNTVATLGTACTLEHLKMLSRCISSLYLLYDGDKAGVQAILRIAQLCWEVNLDVFVVILPEKEDPASFLKNNGDLTKLIGESKNLFSFFIQVVAQGFAQKSLAEKMQLAQKVVDLIAKISDAFKRDLLLQQAATEMQMPFDTLRTLSKDSKQRESYRHHAVQEEARSRQDIKPNSLLNVQEKNEISLLEEKIFSAILNNIAKDAEKLNIDPEMLEYFSVKVRNLLYQLFTVADSCPSHENVFSHYLQGLDEQDQKWVMQISLKFDDVVSKILFEQLLARFYKSNWKYIISDIKRKMVLAKQEKDSGKQNKLMEQFLKLKKDMQSRGLV